MEKFIRELHRLTTCVNKTMLKCRSYYEYLLQGYILGNNINIFITDNSAGFTGAVVGNPLLNSHTGIKLFGYPSMYVFSHVIDMDFSSMYPHIIIAFNIERNTMYGKIFIHEFTEERYDHLFLSDEITDVVSDDDDDDDDDESDDEYVPGYDAGNDFMDNLLVDDPLSLGTKWFNLPEFTEIDKRFKEYFGIKHVKYLEVPTIKVASDECEIIIGDEEEN